MPTIFPTATTNSTLLGNLHSTTYSTNPAIYCTHTQPNLILTNTKIVATRCANCNGGPRTIYGTINTTATTTSYSASASSNTWTTSWTTP